MVRHICVVTSTRADYGILTGLIKKIELDDELELHLVATGMHLDEDFGNTVTEIEKDGFTLDDQIRILEKGEGAKAVTKTMANAITGFSRYFERVHPEVVILLGDRTEIMGVALAALISNIPIAHIHGGELTEGAVDDAIRHSISKMSSIHFVACEEYRKRVIQMGEFPDCVFNVGAMGVENAIKLKKIPKEEVLEKLGVKNNRPYALVTFHPETKSIIGAMLQIQPLMKAMKAHPEMDFIITKANSDAGGRTINELWEQECKVEENWRLYSSLGMKLYLSAVSYANFVIGNSSSAILEVPSFKIASIDIGNRQKGRIMAPSIIHVENEEEEILGAIDEALDAFNNNRFKEIENPFGGGDTADRILEILKEQLRQNKITSKKSFFDIDIEDRI